MARNCEAAVPASKVRFHYVAEERLKVYHHIEVASQKFVDVLGDGENGVYEWVIVAAGGIIEQNSDCGYGSPEVALRDGLIACLGLPNQDQGLTIQPLNKQEFTMELITITVPRIGTTWEGQGGEYAGLCLDDDGRMCHLIVGPEAPAPMTHQGANEWAGALSVDGHSDFALPTRREGRFLQCNSKQSFNDDSYYWLKEQSAGGSGYAWAQDFEDGCQVYWDKRYFEFRARAVRKIPI